MNILKKSSKKNLASEGLYHQILGALLKRWWLVGLSLIGLTSCILAYQYNNYSNSWCWLACLTFVVWLIMSVCRTLLDVFTLRRQETGITWCQISILIAIALWIFGFMFIFNIKQDSVLYLALGIIGTIMAWVFQDILKGIVAFIHLRINHLLNIDDWIQVPKYNVDGIIKRITLTSVTIYNWDNTTSNLPTSALHADHFVNYQKMADGKTYGRMVNKSFYVDTCCFHTISADEAEKLKQLLEKNNDIQYLQKDEIQEGRLNAQLFRLYLYHWLMNHPHISQQPRLVVRWMEHTVHGMTLQIYVFITDSSFAAFEWQQSQIFEHIIESIGWFGLQLYQKSMDSPVKNSNTFPTEPPVTQWKEDVL